MVRRKERLMVQTAAWIASVSWCLLMAIAVAVAKVENRKALLTIKLLGWLSLTAFMVCALVVPLTWEDGQNIILQSSLAGITTLSAVGWFIALRHFMPHKHPELDIDEPS